ncbi:MAG: hypothetical protein AAB309_07085 [Deltaproteobacteria bacterium]
MSEFLKGNYQLKKSIKGKGEETQKSAEKIAQNLKKKALASLGGSMVYVERTDLTWPERGDE